MAESVTVTVLVEGGEHETLMGSREGNLFRVLTGLSFLVEVVHEGKTYNILMDTGTSWKRLKFNAEKMNKDLSKIDCGFITHWHFDHTGALPGLVKSLAPCPPFYTPPREPPWALINGFVEFRLPRSFQRVTVEEPREIVPGVYSTGTLTSDFPLQRHPVHEQALYIPVDGEGLVMLVGCSHPKPQDLLARALKHSGQERVSLLMGGFHFVRPTSESEKWEIVQAFKALDIDRIAPLHCTGVEGTADLAGAFGNRFLQMGLGDTCTVP